MNGIEHGGSDGSQPIRYDFSTNANPLGPPAAVIDAVAQADRWRYPDPGYTELRHQLAAWHSVKTARVLPTAGTSEAIRRLSLAAFLNGIRAVWAPRPGYADYAVAARAVGLAVHEYADADTLLSGLAQAGNDATLVWVCEPNSPTGQSLPASFWLELLRLQEAGNAMIALDLAYQPLRLRAVDEVPIELADRAWRCFSPNKALGTTGIRAGYLLAPRQPMQALIDDALRLSPSWVLSAEGVALLGAWIDPGVQMWLRECIDTLIRWEASQREALDALGWVQHASVTPFWLVRPPEPGDVIARHLTGLRNQGIKLRDATSLGCPGWLRISVQPPEAQQALVAASQRTGLDSA